MDAPCDPEHGPKRRLCLNCDNRHGCKTPEPACLMWPRTPAEARLTGKAFMAARNAVAVCTACPLWRACYRQGERPLVTRPRPPSPAP